MLAAIRIRGISGVDKELKDTMDILGLDRVNALALVPEKSLNMLKKIQAFVAWGEIDNETMDLLKAKLKDNVARLSPPRKGFKSIRLFYPKGDLGYRGKEINSLIRRML